MCEDRRASRLRAAEVECAHGVLNAGLVEYGDDDDDDDNVVAAPLTRSSPTPASRDVPYGPASPSIFQRNSQQSPSAVPTTAPKPTAAAVPTSGVGTWLPEHLDKEPSAGVASTPEPQAADSALQPHAALGTSENGVTAVPAAQREPNEADVRVVKQGHRESASVRQELTVSKWPVDGSTAPALAAGRVDGGDGEQGGGTDADADVVAAAATGEQITPAKRMSTRSNKDAAGQKVAKVDSQESIHTPPSVA
jgi:hypothetical protein